MKTISIPTPQNVTISYEIAGLGERIAAFLIDSTIIWGSIFLIRMLVVMLVAPISWSEYDDFIDYLIIFPIFFFYTLISEISMNGQTWGKRLMGLRVVSFVGRQAVPTDFILRWVFRIIDIYFSVGAIACLMISSTQFSQRIGGVVSNTGIVRIRPRLSLQLKDIMKLSTTDNYRPQYDQVVNMKESEMLLIKNTLQRYKQHPNQAHKEAIDVLSQNVQVFLGLEQAPPDKVVFLKTLLKDYIVLTR